jgi:hypothetical protein
MKNHNKLIILILLLITNSNLLKAQSKTISVNDFNKVIISPHIQVIFKESDKEKVVIEDSELYFKKLNIEVKNKTLRLYLEDAKTTTKTIKVIKDGQKRKVPIYKGTLIKAIIYYKKATTFSLRGEETIVFESPLNTTKIKLNIYGESQIYINEVHLKELEVSIYGESYLEIKKGNIENQKLIAYGESTINTINIDNDSTKITAYGDGNFQFNVLKKLKVTSFGEAHISYTGKPTIKKGIIIGETIIERIR